MDPLTPQEPQSNNLGAVPNEPTPAPVQPVPEAQITPEAMPQSHTPGVVVPAAPPQSGAGHIDIGSILLPKKEVPGQTVLSAQRVNAGALLEQEIAASVAGTHANDPAPTVPKEVPTPTAVVTPPKAEEPTVRALETFQKDIESVVQHDKVSVLSIATAEANRRSASGQNEGEPPTKEEKKRSLLINIVMIGGGLLLLVAASGALAYILTRPTSVPVTTGETPSTPFISVDAVKEITITPDETRSKIMAKLDAARQATSLSLGLMSQLLVTESSSTESSGAVTKLSAEDFLTRIAPSIPASLARSLKPDYLLGVHVYNYNQAFIIANVYSYEEAYSGMLAWEPYLEGDLTPLFNYKPSPRIPEQGMSTTTIKAENKFIQTGFIDKIVENHDARVLQNEYGDVYLLWTFLDRNTLVITTNDATLREIISRLQVAPITPIPGQTAQ